MGNNARLWSAQVRDLSDDCEVIVADYTGAASIDEMADRVLAQVAARSFSPVGFSLGGYIALNLIGRDAVRVDRLAFISASPCADSDQVIEQREFLIEQAQEDYDSVLEDIGKFIVCPKGPFARETREAVTVMGKELGVEEFCRQQRAAMRRPDSREQLSSIQLPVRVLCGAEDRVTPVSGNRYIADHIPCASLQVLEDTGHLLPLERPAEVCGFLREWLWNDLTPSY
jgi:pimeloyl-ACP methyl ester carboxylesterase